MFPSLKGFFKNDFLDCFAATLSLCYGECFFVNFHLLDFAPDGPAAVVFVGYLNKASISGLGRILEK